MPFDREAHHFQQLLLEEGLTVGVIVPQWGTSARYDAQEPEYILSDETVSLFLLNGELEQTYRVQAEDTLWLIAQQYQTTVERLAAYNEMDIHDQLWVNQLIRIPPESWTPS